MHQNRLAAGLCRTYWESLSAPPDPLSATWGLLLREGEGKGRDGVKGEAPNQTYWLRHWGRGVYGQLRGKYNTFVIYIVFRKKNTHLCFRL